MILSSKGKRCKHKDSSVLCVYRVVVTFVLVMLFFSLCKNDLEIKHGGLITISEQKVHDLKGI